MSDPNHLLLPRRTAGDTTGETARLLGLLEGSGEDLTILQVIANSRTLLRPVLGMADALLRRAVLPRDVVEIVILWVAADQGIPYETAEHLPMAQSAGLSSEQIAAAEMGDFESVSLTDDQRLALSIAKVLLLERRLPGEMFRRAIATWGVEGTLDMIASVGWWGGALRVMIDALGLVGPDRQATLGS